MASQLDKLYIALKEYPENEYIYKGCGDYIVVMKLLEDSITNESRKDIININYAKHRTNKVKVILIIHKFTLDAVDNVENSYHEKKLKYTTNEIIEEKDYDMELNNVCSAGIHYFKTIECSFYFTLIRELYTGHYILRHDNGQMYIECDYSDGKINGHYTRWYVNGQTSNECDYTDGEINGHYIEWYKNNQKKQNTIAELLIGILDGAVRANHLAQIYMDIILNGIKMVKRVSNVITWMENNMDIIRDGMKMVKKRKNVIIKMMKKWTLYHLA